jgi:hypothetical protein
MRKITKKLLLLPFIVLFYGALLTINFSCSSSEKDEDKSIIDFQISEIINVTESSAVINANLNTSGKENILFRGICIAMETNPTINNIKYEEQGNVLGQYVGKFENLQHNSKYYARPYIRTNSTTIYGSELTFTTKTISVPTLTTTAISSITQNSAIFNGKIENDGSGKILSKGFYYSKTNSKPEVKDQKVESTGNFEFSNSITDLEQNTTYYVRAFASNLAGTAYGQVVSFITSSYVLPIVTTSPISTIAETTGIGGGTVVSEGSNPVIERGLCWSTAPNPTISYSRTKDGNSIGSFTSNLYSLQPFKLYYIRAYATSAAGTAYGETVIVKTSGGDKPTVVASARTNGTTLYATVTVKTQGSDNVTGISIGCYDMDGNSMGKVVSSSGWNNGNVFAPVNYEITGLSRNNKYYVIGYATNGVGKGASEKVYFMTL